MNSPDKSSETPGEVDEVVLPKVTRKTHVLMERVVQLAAQDYSSTDIAKRIGVSSRYVKMLKKKARELGIEARQEDLLSAPVPVNELPPEMQRLCEFNADAFREFYNKYSGRTLPDHCYLFVQQALSSRRILLNVPPGHMKSSVFAVWIPIWLIARNRDVQILLLSKTQKLSLKMAREITFHLENNHQLIRDFRRFKSDDAIWRVGELIVEGRRRDILSGDLTLLAIGAGQQVYGLRADWIIADDLVDTENSLTQHRREELSNWFHTEVLTRRNPSGRVCVIGTRFHPADLYFELSDKKTRDVEGQLQHLWKHINFPALIGDWETGRALWPEIWPMYPDPLDPDKGSLKEIYEESGHARWEQVYQQNPIPEGETLVRTEWIYGENGCLDIERPLGASPWKNRNEFVRVISLDPSPTMYAGWVVADIPFDRNQFRACVLEVRSVKQTVRQMLDYLKSLTGVDGKYGKIDYLVVEKNIAHFFLQDPELQQFVRGNSIRLVEHVTTRNKVDPEYGIQSLARDFEFGCIRLPWGDTAAQQNSKLLIDEATQHPYSATDDILLALWFLRFNHKKLRPKTSGIVNKLGGFHIPPRLLNGFGGSSQPTAEQIYQKMMQEYRPGGMQ